MSRAIALAGIDQQMDDLEARYAKVLGERKRPSDADLFLSDIEIASNRALSRLIVRIMREQGLFNGLISRDDSKRGWRVHRGNRLWGSDKE